MEFLKGMDISSLKEVESLGGRFYDHGVEKDVLDILKSYGANAVRLRLWNDPYSEDGKPYGAGGNDLPTTIELTKRALAKGMEVLLDFHYSDCWADPGKQRVPKAWRGMNLEQLEKAVYDYTKETLETLKEENAFPSLVQVGNEVSNGLLWPYGRTPDYDSMIKLLNAGIRGVRAVDKDIPIMMHLDNGGNNALYREWFDHFMEKGEDFQIIGLSYYPFWHGTLDDLSNNLNDIALRYGKELMLAEVSMGFTMEDYASYEKLEPHERKGMATRPALVGKVPYPMTKEGQKAYLEDLFARMKKVPGNKVSGFFYWEAAWIPVPGSGWGSEEAIAYMEEKGPGGNEWANQALFDYDGNALPALEAIRDFTV
ncbi:MAG: glycosyl hydrolase 53 family protein [Blautia sp.]|nr:glycosyl hydrolase 53 family protein [Lachnoclostridium sp.]MCM1211070.1 glycosyl hydrolase 53 family protein [Blautia sp.]